MKIKKLPDSAGVSRKRFNEIRKETNNAGNIYPKVGKNKNITIKSIKDLFDRINELNPNKKKYRQKNL